MRAVLFALLLSLFSLGSAHAETAFLRPDDNGRGLNAHISLLADPGSALSIDDLQRLGVAHYDLTARPRGYEFAVLLTGPNVEQDAGLIAERPLAELSQPVPYRDIRLVVRISIGAAFFPRHADDFSQLYKAADDALYPAKHLGAETGSSKRLNSSLRISRHSAAAPVPSPWSAAHSQWSRRPAPARQSASARPTTPRHPPAVPAGGR